LAFAPDGRSVYTGSLDQTVRRWDVTTGRQTEVLKDLRGKVTALHVGPGDFVYVGTELMSSSGFRSDGDPVTRMSMVHRWDAATGKATRFLKGQKAGVSHMEVSPDGRLIVLRENQSVLRARPEARSPFQLAQTYDPEFEQVSVWDTETGERLCRWPSNRDYERPRPRFSPDGTMVLYLTDNSDELALYDARTGQRVRTLPMPKKDNQGGHWGEARFSPDGRVVAGHRSGNRELWFWDTATGERLGSYTNTHPSMSWEPQFVFSPDSKRLALAVDRVVQIVDVGSRRGMEVLRGHENSVTALSFSADGMRLLTGSLDQTAALWDVVSGRLLTVYRGHAWAVNLLAFSPDGTRVATSNVNEVFARVWAVDVLPEFERRKPRELTTAERVRYELPPAAAAK
jgi:WD40 repeat protein